MRNIDNWEKEEMFSDLDDMRNSGENMNWGPKYLRDEFDLTKSEAYSIFCDWTMGFVPKKDNSVYGR